MAAEGNIARRQRTGDLARERAKRCGRRWHGWPAWRRLPCRLTACGGWCRRTAPPASWSESVPRQVPTSWPHRLSSQPSRYASQNKAAERWCWLTRGHFRGGRLRPQAVVSALKVWQSRRRKLRASSERSRCASPEEDRRGLMLTHLKQNKTGDPLGYHVSTRLPSCC